MKRNKYASLNGFTIVELLIVIVVIAILAAITIVSYSGISSRAKAGAAQSGAESAAKKVITYATTNSEQLPSDLQTAGINTSTGTLFEYSKNTSVSPQTFCITATVSGTSYYIDNTTHTSPTSGLCPGHSGGGPAVIADGSSIQTITSSNCPTTRTRGVDARDNHTYWIQKMADGKCWMLTNLGYAGGGTNTYGDVMSTSILQNGTGAGAGTYTDPQYYVVPSTTNYTTEPTAPSTTTDGGATNSQYGYLYNWCAAMGAQATSACANATTPAPNPALSICPAGWRLPTGNGGEFAALNTAVNSGSGSSDAGLRSAWLGQRAGGWNHGFDTPASYGYYWSSTQNSNVYGYDFYFANGYANPAYSNYKNYGMAVRCVAN